MQFYLLTFYSNTMPLFITLISIIGLIAYFAISIYNVVGSSKLETSENKTIRFPLPLIQEIESVIANQDVTFSSFVLQACEYALKNMDKDENKSE